MCGERERSRRYLPHILTIQEWDALMRHACLFRKAMLGMMFYGGLRISEVKKLLISDVNIHTGTVYVFTTKQKARPMQRMVTLPDVFIPTLKRFLSVFEPEVYLFEKKPGLPYNLVSSFTNVWLKKLAKQAGLYNGHLISNYSLRHSYAVILYEGGTPMEEISSSLGHAHVEMTRDYYVHLSYKLKHDHVNQAFGLDPGVKDSYLTNKQAAEADKLQILLVEVLKQLQKEKEKRTD